MSAIGVFRENSREQHDLSLFLAAGPLSLVFTSCVALQRSGNLDLLFVVLLGSLLCLKMRTRGLFFSLLLLLIGAITKHFFFLDHHFWRCGIESSIALGLFISTMGSELFHQQKEKLSIQAASKEQIIRNLEEELLLVRKEAQEEKTTLKDRLASLQIEFEEVSGDLAALQILNDVLRKTSAKQSKDLEELQQKLSQLQESQLAQDQKTLSSDQTHELYLQLRSQFEEKNQILHQTRRQLFATETRLERIAVEKELTKSAPSFSPLEKELIAEEENLHSLEQENQELIELVTLLSTPPQRKKREKKIKEDLLFYSDLNRQFPIFTAPKPRD